MRSGFSRPRGGWKPYAGDDFETDRHANKQGEELWAVDQVLSRLGFQDYRLTAQDKPDVLVGFGAATHNLVRLRSLSPLHGGEPIVG